MIFQMATPARVGSATGVNKIKCTNSNTDFNFSDSHKQAGCLSFLLHFVLDFSAAHARAVEKQFKISAREAFKLGYRSTPTEQIGKVFAENVFSDWLRTRSKLRNFRPPGVYCDGESLCLNLPARNLVVPVRGASGNLIALQLCPNLNDEKLFWFSSAGLPGGTKASAKAHVSRGKAVKNGICFLTENTLQADSLAFATGCCAVAANVAPFSLVESVLRELGVRVLVVVAPVNQNLLQFLSTRRFRLHFSEQKERRAVNES